MSILNENDLYFSHLFSMSKKHKDHPDDPSKERKSGHHTYGDQIDAEAEKFIQRKHEIRAQENQEDVDAEAEDFIEHEHLKFELSKWMSMNMG